MGALTPSLPRPRQVLFTNHHSKQFLIFVAMAVLHSHRDVILRYLSEVRPPSLPRAPASARCARADPDAPSAPSLTSSSSTATSSAARSTSSRRSTRPRSSSCVARLRPCPLASLARAPDLSLCPGLPLAQLSFRSLVEDVDRRQALRDGTGSEGLRNRKSAHLSSGEQLGADEDFAIPHLPAISLDLRDLLD